MSAEAAPSAEISCPQCGGANPLPAGERLLVCRWCEASLFADRAGVVLHYWIPRRLGAEPAEASLRRWMAGNHTVKHLDRRAELTAAEPQSFPVWMFRARAGAPGSRGTVRLEPAAPTPIPALADLEVPVGELSPRPPVDEPGGPARSIEATVPLERARAWLGERLDGGSGAGSDLTLEETSLVHVPLWRMAYRFDDRDWVALVDASTGEVFASVFPSKPEAPYGLVAGLGLVVFLVLGFVTANPFLKLAFFLVAAVPVFLVAWLVTRTV